MSVRTRDYDPAHYLDNDDSIEEYLAATCEDGDPAEIAHALGVVARSRGIADLAKKTGLTRQALYKALSGEGNPELGTIAKVARALGYRLALVRAARSRRRAA
ncbi:MAG: putative addiction module antidote protein [Hyphomicrobiales bacterium]|nr:putative addiction module antidote protein [Hyphomicrobiales bacterium]MBV9054796.1 putative addiction module antidote protein [Hyphomicrobiales bacterium]MBV9135796.1 putative addiction module antidote protein [Hyphomicrobiales bacterium]MBV9973987.1 putative addiction module antidote protein [Hyphomicrobiales bacterium]